MFENKNWKFTEIWKAWQILIQAIVFDVDDTLYDQQQPFRNAVYQIVPDFQAEDMHELYIRFRVHSDEIFPKVLAGEWDLVTMRNFRIQQSLKDLGYSTIDDETALNFQAIYETELDHITMHDEVKKTLDHLKKLGVPMGIITNGPTDHQFKKIKQLELFKWVRPEHILISQATGFQKPEAEIFQLAEERFDLDGATTLYVGDSFENDVVGAKSRDWQALWFNHRERCLPAGAEAIYDVELTDFEQLYPTICSIFTPLTV